MLRIDDQNCVKNKIVKFIFLCAIFSVVSTIILLSCAKNPFHNYYLDTENSLLNIFYIYNNNAIYGYNYQNKTDSILIYLSEDINECLYDFDVDKKSNTFYLSTRTEQQDGKAITKILKISNDGIKELYIKESPVISYPSYYILEINLSPNKYYLAVTERYYTIPWVSIFNLTNDSLYFCNSNLFTDDYSLNFIAWHPTKPIFYNRFMPYLIECNVDYKEFKIASSSNIRDYINTSELLKQGYLGERFDYNSKIEIENPDKVIWSPDGNEFVYAYNDSLFIFTIHDSTKSFLHAINSTRENNYLFNVVWGSFTNVTEINDTLFNNNDLYAYFDSSVLDSIYPMNDDFSYQIHKSYNSIPTLKVIFKDSINTNSGKYANYFFKNCISKEKFNIAELDFLFYTYSSNKEPQRYPAFKYYSDTTMNESDFMEIYYDYKNNYYGYYNLFQGITYPLKLSDKKEKYDSLIFQNYCFHSLFYNFIENKDLNAFTDSLLNLFSEKDTQKLFEALDTFSLTGKSDRYRYYHFQVLMHNNFLNYYGEVIDKDFKSIFSELLIIKR